MSSDPVISARSVGKTYRIARSQQRATTLAELLVQKIRRPFSRGEDHADFHALHDVSFEVRRGEVLGIIGRNGAGKSTLLKILAQITPPTTGEIDLHGRVGSLLEVGTGFHPELTGRENIYLNGAILGMSRREIARQFDSIVAFAETEAFLDVPVKRYSSGMYVRLAFAVAAHLDPEILIVDEVLAVGDVQFQRKCMGMMNDIARTHQRTILFVSHNIAALRALCTRAILLDHGRVIADGPVGEVVDCYLDRFGGERCEVEWNAEDAPKSEEFGFRFLRAWIENSRGQAAAALPHDQPFAICTEYEVRQHLPGLRIGFFMQNSEGVAVCGSNDVALEAASQRTPGRYVSRCKFPAHILNEDRYQVQFGADTYGAQSVTKHLCLLTPFSLSFAVEDIERHQGGRSKLPGVIRPPLHWAVEPGAVLCA